MDIKDTSISQSWQGHETAILAVFYEPVGDSFISIGIDNMKVWDLQGRQIGNPFQVSIGSDYSFAFSPDNEFLLVSAVSNKGSGVLEIYQLKDSSPVSQLSKQMGGIHVRRDPLLRTIRWPTTHN